MTCLEGVKGLDGGAPLLFNDCDHMFVCRDFYDFCAAGDFSAPDAALLTFTSDVPKYASQSLTRRPRSLYGRETGCEHARHLRRVLLLPP